MREEVIGRQWMLIEAAACACLLNMGSSFPSYVFFLSVRPSPKVATQLQHSTPRIVHSTLHSAG
ncbi:hypothetical protein GT037_007456 [Alternaria burnsii]|uniref:Uncharacterized protein n=1 Tax=Alternaria burnsii TaxID=1187904 RepID=A0A8H7EE05_9PLEO|nr:uncharacterized protein GT037_007456 [Alternaria burnsii]KAF7674696.1 hypothetical protein GT037_007456 [Alternaria burnsii]